ncbi:MAG: T9SS type A sorting domain-containing protein [Gemmatimonadetes bacterium]|nr:T9SS type A sorting domain-containing protein [Gemmatimonadota bacterium]
MSSTHITRAIGRALPLMLLMLPRTPLHADLSPSMHLGDDGSTLVQSGPAANTLYDETVLRTLELQFAQTDWWDQLAANYGTGENILADLTVEGITYPEVGVRFRGNTSYTQTGNSEKKSFNIELDFVDEDQALMGYRTLNLNNANLDASFMREVLYFHEARDYIPTPKANHVRLTINGQNWGVYANVQQINADMVAEWFASNDGDRWKIEPQGGDTAGGAGTVPGGQPPGGTVPPAADTTSAIPGQQPPAGGVRPDGGVPPVGGTRPNGGAPPVAGRQPGGSMFGGDKALTWLGDDPATYEPLYQLKAANTDDPWGHLIALCDVLNSTPVDQLEQTLDPIMDVDRWLWFLAVESVLGDDDSYLTKGSDYQLYFEPESGRMHPLQYDGNEALNVRLATRDPMEGEDNVDRPIISQLLSVPSLRQRYLAHLRTVLNRSLTWETVGPLVEQYGLLIDAEVRADNRKLYTTEAFEDSPAELEDFVDTRRAFLLAHAEVDQSTPEILAVDAERTSAEAHITARVGTSPVVAEMLLHWSFGLTKTFSTAALFDDGAHGDGAANDGTYGAVLPLPDSGWVRYYVEARADDGIGTAAFAPAGAEHDVYVLLANAPRATSSPIWITELMASNQGAVLDPQGDSDDWIELTNVSGEQVDLSGMSLSDDTEDLRKWSLPEGTILAPGASLVVWADGDDDDPGLHANFKLSQSGEVVTLTDAPSNGGALLELVSFSGQLDDVSYGRLPEDMTTFGFLDQPTPGSANTGVITAVTQDPDDSLPTNFLLGQNYPNPFNGTTIIPFTIPDAGSGEDLFVTLDVYNLSGQRVISLMSGSITSGQYSITWDGRNQRGHAVSSGLYFYRLEAGSFLQTRKLTLVQ